MLGVITKVWDFLVNAGAAGSTLPEKWRDYLDTNTSADLSGVNLDDAERLFLLEKLSLASSNKANADLWNAYFLVEGIGGVSLEDKMSNWIDAGGAVVPSGNWILATGAWSDAGEWDDADVWNDA